MFHGMPEWFLDFVFTLNRWIHIVGTALILGGILFFEFVVPLATADLREEQRLAVFGRVRWIFRRVVWFSMVAMLLSGALSLVRVWPIYQQERLATGSGWLTSAPWAAGHMLLGVLGFALALRITAGKRLLERPIDWLRANLVILLAAVFLAAAARHLELHLGHWGKTTSYNLSHAAVQSALR